MTIRVLFLCTGNSACSQMAEALLRKHGGKKFEAHSAADQLSLSAKTVETYRARGMEKLGLRIRAALVKFALKEGLIKQE